MELCVHATHTAVLCILFIVVSWSDVNAQRHRSDEVVSRRIREDTSGFYVEETLEQFRNTLDKLKHNCSKLEDALIKQRISLDNLEYDITEIKAALTNQDKNTRALQEKVLSILHFQEEFQETVAGFRGELAGVKRELVEDRNALDQKFLAPLEILNQTVQLLAHRPYEDLSRQVAELKAEQQQLVSTALQKALQEMSQLKKDYTSEIAALKAEQQKQAAAAFDIFEQSENMKKALEEMTMFRENYTSKADLRNKRAISNKCSLNVRHKPEGGHIDVLMVMDPPDIDPAVCN